MDRCQVISTEETVSNTQQLKQILQMNSFDFYSPCAEKMETILSSGRIAYFFVVFYIKNIHRGTCIIYFFNIGYIWHLFIFVSNATDSLGSAFFAACLYINGFFQTRKKWCVFFIVCSYKYKKALLPNKYHNWYYLQCGSLLLSFLLFLNKSLLQCLSNVCFKTLFSKVRLFTSRLQYDLFF